MGWERFTRSEEMKRAVEESLELLKSFQQPVFRWRQQLGLKDNDNTNTMK